MAEEELEYVRAAAEKHIYEALKISPDSQTQKDRWKQMIKERKYIPQDGDIVVSTPDLLDLYCEIVERRLGLKNFGNSVVHEKTHAEKAEDLGGKHKKYVILVGLENKKINPDGAFVYNPWGTFATVLTIVNAPQNVSKEGLKEFDVLVASAPGNEMSSFDKQVANKKA